MWYLLSEIYPKKDSFGPIFSDIRDYVKGILESKDQFSNCFEKAKLFFCSSQKNEILEAIFHNPECYAGYFLNSVPVHLVKQEDFHAEQNYFSVVAYLGKSGSMIVAKQMYMLIDRVKEQV